MWRRASDVYGHNGQPLRVFNGIDPTDIIQGVLGDCYFLGCVALHLALHLSLCFSVLPRQSLPYTPMPACLCSLVHACMRLCVCLRLRLRLCDAPVPNCA